jgi:hypothetical protein
MTSSLCLQISSFLGTDLAVLIPKIVGLWDRVADYRRHSSTSGEEEEEEEEDAHLVSGPSPAPLLASLMEEASWALARSVARKQLASRDMVMVRVAGMTGVAAAPPTRHLTKSWLSDLGCFSGMISRGDDAWAAHQSPGPIMRQAVIFANQESTGWQI